MESIRKLILLYFCGALLLFATACQSQTVQPKALERPDLPTSTKIPATATPAEPTVADVLNQTATFTASPTADTVVPGESIFGVGIDDASPEGGLTQMTDAKVSWLRLPGVEWSKVEATQGTYDWSALADLEEELANVPTDMEVVLLVHSTPEWARQTAGSGSSCGPIAADKFAAFASFMEALVARYSIAPYHVKYWEIWNEEDTPYIEGDSGFGCWGDLNDPYFGGGYYGEMLKVVYPQIKSANPQAQVLIGGLMLDCDPRGGCSAVGNSALPAKFLEGILQTPGAAAAFDGVSFHAYDYYLGKPGEFYNPNWQSSWDTTGPVLGNKTQYILGVLNQYGVTGKTLMNTEVALICGRTGLEAPCQTDDFYATKASYLTQSYAASFAYGLKACMWYSVFGWRNSGLLNDDLSPQIAYTSLKFEISELKGAVYHKAISGADVGGISGVAGYGFIRDGKPVWVVWSQDGDTHSISLATAPKFVWDSTGKVISPGRTLDIPLDPIFLEWDQ